MAVATPGSVTWPSVGDQTMRMADSPEPLGGSVESISVAVVDSVSGSANESLSSPPKRVPINTTSTMVANHAMSAHTGLRTAQRDRAPMEISLTHWPPGLGDVFTLR